MKNNAQRPCPACKSSNAELRGAKNGFEILVCRDCRSIYTGHLPAITDAENYDEYYTESNLSVPDFVVERVREIIGGFSAYRQTNRLLDIGFGAGTILEVAAEDKWNAFGLEVSKPAIDQAKARGFEVFHGNLFESAYPDQHFDVITASEIVEHLPDPESDLKEIARILRPGGLFWATTPYATGLSFRLLGLDWSILSPPEHTQLYSRRGISQMLENAGFSSIRLQTFGLNPMEIAHHFRSRKDETISFNRVETGYQLNESLSRSPARKAIKSLLNNTLNVFHLGDSLKIFAHKK